VGIDRFLHLKSQHQTESLKQAAIETQEGRTWAVLRRYRPLDLSRMLATGLPV
jgi:hypothetical protein